MVCQRSLAQKILGRCKNLGFFQIILFHTLMSIVFFHSYMNSKKIKKLQDEIDELKKHLKLEDRPDEKEMPEPEKVLTSPTTATGISHS